MASMTLEEAMLIIERQELEIEKLKEEQKANRRKEATPKAFKEKFAVTCHRLGDSGQDQLRRTIRTVCFPKSVYRKSGRFGKPAALHLEDMDEEQYAKYSNVLFRILTILEENAYVSQEDREYIVKWYPGRSEHVKDSEN